MFLLKRLKSHKSPMCHFGTQASPFASIYKYVWICHINHEYILNQYIYIYINIHISDFPILELPQINNFKSYCFSTGFFSFCSITSPSIFRFLRVSLRPLRRECLGCKTPQNPRVPHLHGYWKNPRYPRNNPPKFHIDTKHDGFLHVSLF